MNLEPATWIALGLIAALAVYVILLCGMGRNGSDDDR